MVNRPFTSRDYSHGVPRKRFAPDQIAIIGLRLRAAREAIDDLDQKPAAISVNVAPNTWNQWENGKRPADPFAMARFCNQYGVTMDWIYRGSMVGLPASLRQKVALRYRHLLREAGLESEIA